MRSAMRFRLRPPGSDPPDKALSRRRRCAEELRESERRMELAGDAANLGMWAWDIDHRSIWANSRARSLLGFSESELLSLDKFTNAIHPDDRDLSRHAIESALATDNEYEVEYRVPRTDGEIRWISSRGRVGRDVAGKPVLVRGVVIDVSARRGPETLRSCGPYWSTSARTISVPAT